MSADKQHSFRVTAAVKAAFSAYAATFEMQESELVRLLIIRELRHRQLQAFIADGGQVTGGSGGDIKVTAHFPSIAAAAEFHAHASNCGVGSGRAGAWIIERELSERWFEQVLAKPPLSPCRPPPSSVLGETGT